MEAFMYVCPECKMVYKVKGNDKKVRCTRCTDTYLIDMLIPEEDWKSYTKSQKAYLIDEVLSPTYDTDYATEYADYDPATDNEYELNNSSYEEGDDDGYGDSSNSLFDILEDSSKEEAYEPKKKPARAKANPVAGKRVVKKSAEQKPAPTQSNAKKSSSLFDDLPGESKQSKPQPQQGIQAKRQSEVQHKQAVANSTGNVSSKMMATQNDITATQTTPEPVQQVVTTKYILEGRVLKTDVFMCIMCLLFPVVGWMLYAFNAAASPKAARRCMIFALIGTVILAIIYFVYSSMYL